jgi:hypothetical protein
MEKNKFENIPRTMEKNETPEKIIESGPCEKYGLDVYEKYNGREMSLNDMESFAEHCEQCSVCRKEIAENELLFSRTQQLLDSLDKDVIK